MLLRFIAGYKQFPLDCLVIMLVSPWIKENQP